MKIGLVVLLQIGFVILALRYIMTLVMATWSSIKYEVPFVPSSNKARQLAVKTVEMEEGQRFVELGSGDGRVCLMFVRRYPIKAMGVERNRWLHWLAKLRSKLDFRKKGEVRWVRGDLFEVDLTEADVVYMYLLSSMIERLKPNLEKMKKGSKAISWHYKLKSDQFELIGEVGGWRKLRVYEKII